MKASDSGVILVNLGTPSAPTKVAVADFLRQFLSDQRVVEAPRWLWWWVLNAAIIPLRASRVATAYRTIWTDRGSPLRVVTEDQALALEAALGQRCNDRQVTVTHAMTYGEPSLAFRIAELQRRNLRKIVVVPLFPQYSATTTGAVYDQVADFIRASRNIPDIHVIKQYYQNPRYIEALASSVRRHRQAAGAGQKLLMSFHGLPEAYAKKGDPYPTQCIETATALAAQLDLEPERWAYAFQSRFGRQEWVKPYTDTLLVAWAEAGIENIDVICPSFAADCLETLEEMAMRNRDLFCNHGGKRLTLIPCLNSDHEHMEMLVDVVDQYL
jgi:ferrochelatase